MKRKKTQDNFLLQSPKMMNLTDNSAAIQTSNEPVEIKFGLIKELKLLDFIESVCIDSETTEGNVVDKFFKKMVHYLLHATDGLPHCKSKIHKILSVLINIGVGNVIDEIDKESFQVEFNDPRLNLVYYMSLIDKKINVLMEEKTKLYNQILIPTSQDVINLEMDETREFNQKLFSTRIEEPVIDTFPTNVIENALQGQSKLIIVKQECLKEKNIGKKTFDLPENSGRITVLNVYKKNYCIAGCDDGSIMLFSLKTGKLLDLIYPHAKPITSLISWEQKIITTSMDGFMKCYDLTQNTVKSVNLKKSITCTDEKDGNLYVGSDTGHIYKYNMRSMKRIENPVQLAKIIIDIKVIKHASQEVLVVVTDDTVSLRSSKTGSLLRNLRSLKETKCLAVDSFDPIIYTGRDSDKVSSLNVITSKEVVKEIPHEASKIIIHENLLLVAGSDYFIYFYTKKLRYVSKIARPPGKVIAMSVSDSSVILTTDEISLSMLEIPVKILERINPINIKNS